MINKELRQAWLDKGWQIIEQQGLAARGIKEVNGVAVFPGTPYSTDLAIKLLMIGSHVNHVN